MHSYRRLTLLACSLGLAGILFTGTTLAQEASRSFEIQTADGLTVFGDVYEPENVKRPPLILAFHQGGGDGRGEYAPIIPKLLEAGYAVISVDQRQGGSVFEGVNRTVAALHKGVEYSYCDAYPDLEATLEFARTQGFGRIVAWGSSYSATLVLRLAADYPEDIDRVIAFSPAGGEPMGACQPREYAANVSVPAMMVRPEREAAIASVAGDLEAFQEMGHRTYVSPGGSHGSSVLVAERTNAATDAVWEVVLAFLSGSD